MELLTGYDKEELLTSYVRQERDELIEEVKVAWEQVHALRSALMQYGHLPDCPFLKGGSVDCWCPDVVAPKNFEIVQNGFTRNALRSAFIEGAVWAVDETDESVVTTLRNHAFLAASARWPEKPFASAAVQAITAPSNNGLQRTGQRAPSTVLNGFMEQQGETARR